MGSDTGQYYSVSLHNFWVLQMLRRQIIATNSYVHRHTASGMARRVRFEGYKSIFIHLLNQPRIVTSIVNRANCYSTAREVLLVLYVSLGAYVASLDN